MPMLNRDTQGVTTGQAIDPAVFQDPVSKKYYLFWGNGDPLYGELSDDMKSIKAGTIKKISGLTDFREGAFLNYRQGLYHLTYSIDDTGSPNYRVGYATSTSVDGPWTYRGVILEKDASQGILATGHSSILNVAGTDDWYIAYHRFGIPVGSGSQRETTIDKLTFGADGLMQKVTPTLTSIAARPVKTPPVLTPPVVTPPVVVPPVLAPLMPPAPGLGAKLKGKGYEVGRKVKVVLTMDVDGLVKIKVDGKKKTVRVTNGRAVVKVRFLKPGLRKVVVTTAGDRVVKKVRVRP
jgi:hypothetical protein